MKKFSSVFSCFHTDMNKYIFPVQQKISGNFPENFLEIFRNIFFRKSYITNYNDTRNFKSQLTFLIPTFSISTHFNFKISTTESMQHKSVSQNWQSSLFQSNCFVSCFII